MLRFVLILCLAGLAPFTAHSDPDRLRLYAPPALVQTGVFGYLLPRFRLKTQVGVDLVAEAALADVVLGDAGRPLFQAQERTWHLDIRDITHAGAQRLDGWFASGIGLRTVLSYKQDGITLFSPPPERAPEAQTPEMEGDAALGQQVALTKCIRCHVIDDQTRRAGIGSTPSFAVLRSLPDWEERFAVFYALNPHPSFTIVPGVTPPFPDNRPPPIVPITVTLDELEAILAFAASLQPADLGAFLQHQ